MADINSAYYPYERIYDYTNLPHADTLFSKVVNYLLDLPDARYTPKDDNRLPRCRLNKLLYWDGADPLRMPLPTPEQKLSLVCRKPRHKCRTHAIEQYLKKTRSHTCSHTHYGCQYSHHLVVAQSFCSASQPVKYALPQTHPLSHGFYSLLSYFVRYISDC